MSVIADRILILCPIESADHEIEAAVVPILRVEDAALAVPWYARLGFVKESEHLFEPGFPAFVTVVRGKVRLFLCEHKGDAPPDGLVYLRVADVDAVAAEFGVKPEDVPWGREIELRDPDGNRIRVGAPRADHDLQGGTRLQDRFRSGQTFRAASIRKATLEGRDRGLRHAHRRAILTSSGAIGWMRSGGAISSAS